MTVTFVVLLLSLMIESLGRNLLGLLGQWQDRGKMVWDSSSLIFTSHQNEDLSKRTGIVGRSVLVSSCPALDNVVEDALHLVHLSCGLWAQLVSWTFSVGEGRSGLTILLPGSDNMRVCMAFGLFCVIHPDQVTI